VRCCRRDNVWRYRKGLNLPYRGDRRPDLSHCLIFWFCFRGLWPAGRAEGKAAIDYARCDNSLRRSSAFATVLRRAGIRISGLVSK
jgi:hypothetical protein